jgi:sugar (pentulose or hexulose) kinase
MMPRKVTAIFDIGKTNKKFFLFDMDYQKVYQEYKVFEELRDEDGFPTEDLRALLKWIDAILQRIMEENEYTIIGINFTTYGASLVHIDQDGNILTPLYNYMKPIDEEIITSFYNKYGPEKKLSQETGSPKLRMLNSGMQLYWLKHSRPKIFNKIKYSLHFPQFLSYVYTGIASSEYTSIGCHTLLWDYSQNDYHNWVYAEGINNILAPIASAKSSNTVTLYGKNVKIGKGIHDSSAALIPYLEFTNRPFVLVSTGTWSIALNPFSDKSLNAQEDEEAEVVYMRINGQIVKSARLLLGKEYEFQVAQLKHYFGAVEGSTELLKFNREIFERLAVKNDRCFRWKYLFDMNMPDQTELTSYHFDEAYHQLIIELVYKQLKCIEVALGDKKSVENIYIVGGFNNNEVFIKILTHYLKGMNVMSRNTSFGSALGAALVLFDIKSKGKMLKMDFL